jgi:outer membrane protein assembly factor BamB
MKNEAEGLKKAHDVELRLWPGMVAASVIVIGLLIGLSLTVAMPDAALAGMVAAIVGALAVILWWLFFSRARWSERLAVVAVLIAAWFGMRPFLDRSVIGGAMGGLPFFTVPVLAAALVVWASATRNLSKGSRQVSLVAAMLIACGLCTLVRTAGIRGGFFEFHWRWTPSPEQRLLASANDDPTPIAAAPATTEASNEAPAVKAENANKEPATVSAPPAALRKPPEWPGFRGSDRDGIVHNVRIETDWSKSPPVELWRRPIGPGWSSFAVDGDLLYTQEQRGDDEIIASYRLSTGKPVWRHRDATRFWESNGGAGPRGTPTLSNGRVYAFGATGILNVLDAVTGALIWSRNVSADSKVQVPMWGFSSSPLVIDDIVVVAAEAKLAAYDSASGNPRWFSPEAGFSYSSPHRLVIDGVPQIVLLGGGAATSFAPSSGQVLWRHEWPGGAIVQPAVMADGNVLINTLAVTGGQAIRRLAVTHTSNGWTVDERWTSTGLKPYFNDFVVHNGHALGFDGSILSCIDLADGSRKWKGGRYGGGQLVLLADQDLLLVLSDEGELALVSATPAEFKELARFKAIEGKTWNHPVLVRDTLLVRNGEEMAAFRLSMAQ